MELKTGMERGTRNVQWGVTCPRCVTSEIECRKALPKTKIQWGQIVDVQVKFPSIEEKSRQREDSPSR